jgi:hypothetical protein
MALNSFEYAQVENEIDWLKEKIESLRERAKRQPSTVREIHDMERQIKERQVKLMFDPRKELRAERFKAVKIALILLLVAPLYAQLPEAPKSQQLDRVEWGLLATDAGVRGLDVYSTHQALQNGNRELFLPSAVVDHVPAMAAYSAGTVVLDWYFARLLTRHHHRTWAHVLTSVDIGTTAPWAVHNLYLPDENLTSSPRINPGDSQYCY